MHILLTIMRLTCDARDGIDVHVCCELQYIVCGIDCSSIRCTVLSIRVAMQQFTVQLCLVHCIL